MSDLKLLTDRLIENKKSEVQDKINEAEAEKEQLLAESAKNLAEEKAKQISLIDSRLARKFEQDKHTLQINKRNQLLSEKQKVLTVVFNEAEEQMNQWTDSEFQQFLLSVLKEHRDSDSIELIVGQESVNKVTKDWIDKVAKEVVNIQLSTETISKKNGFILKKSGIQYNYLFDELVKDINGQLVSSVSKQLFD
ncbi:ATPase [Carnobacterium inhibens]|uniref:ATPase n=2 Tax=Carnobacterium inhibens TaxID=147709 RepID=U5S8C6_9LACT|nr:ATPase [Carnobacterium inhibens]AGY81519.1 ATPase [Carnobacterium inhibens subsp. gilichinskyi]MBC9824668.1 ATPase [Carnobacterium inhibens]